MKLAYVDPKLLAPPSRSIMGVLGAIEQDTSLWDRVLAWFAPNGDADAPSAAVRTASGDVTVGEAAERLLATRQVLASAWPVVKTKASSLTDGEKSVWNAVQAAQIDLELSLARRIVELGAKDDASKALVMPSSDVLQKRLQAGRFAGIPNAELGQAAQVVTVLGLQLTTWIAIVFGILITGAGVAWLTTQLVKSFDAEDLARIEAGTELVKCVASGQCPAGALQYIRDLKIPEPNTMPGWAKGVIAVGAVVAGVVLVVNLAPLLRGRR